MLVTAGATTYAQDRSTALTAGLAAPLSQVLSDGTTSYLYGHQRLAALGQSWYVGDALGSVRQTLDGSGAVLAATGYDPWGTPQQPLTTPFGFTGELQQQDRVQLRARWYDPGNGTFTSRDPFAGFTELPYSLHPYQYAYSAPTTWVDPTGEFVPSVDVTFTYDPQNPLDPIAQKEPIIPEVCSNSITLRFFDMGLFIGVHAEIEIGAFVPGIGIERVWDLLSFERMDFEVQAAGAEGYSITGLVTGLGGDVSGYIGIFDGIKNYDVADWSVERYQGVSVSVQGNVQVPGDLASAGVTIFASTDFKIKGAAMVFGVGINAWPFPISGQVDWNNIWVPIEGSLETFREAGQRWPSAQSGAAIQRDTLGIQSMLAALGLYTYAIDASLAINHNARQWQRLQDWLAEQA